MLVALLVVLHLQTDEGLRLYSRFLPAFWFFILIWLVVTQILEMKLLGSIFDTLMNVGVIALIVLFQDEIRRFLLTLGSHRHVSALAHFFSGARKEA